MLFAAFWDIDADGSGKTAETASDFASYVLVLIRCLLLLTGTIRPIEFYSYFNIELSDFERFIFGVFDNGIL
jgi:hypothetical protein